MLSGFEPPPDEGAGPVGSCQPRSLYCAETEILSLAGSSAQYIFWSKNQGHLSFPTHDTLEGIPRVFDQTRYGFKINVVG